MEAVVVLLLMILRISNGELLDFSDTVLLWIQIHIISGDVCNVCMFSVCLWFIVLTYVLEICRIEPV